MFKKFVLPAVAVAMFSFAIFHVLGAQREPKPAPPVGVPARSPYAHTVAGSGIIEALTENIAIGAYVPGIVAEVFVKATEKVEAGQKLFRLDDRQVRADLKVKQANLAAAKMQLAKLQSMPRSEELPPAEARVREAEANLLQAEDQMRRSVSLERSGAITEGELFRWRQAEAAARAQLARARADYDLLKAGAWEADKAVAQATVEQAQAQVEQVQVDLDRLLVRAPIEGEVLQSNVNPGEYVGAPPGQALIVLGNVRQFHVRVDIDEHDIPRFREGSPAVATLRGNPEVEYPLSFVRVEPYVIPKRSLTGDNTERVDTRVLQVLYSLESQGRPLYVGQQVDVSIQSSGSEADLSTSGATETTTGK